MFGGVNGEDGNVIKSYQPQLKEEQSHVESICLKEGRYNFIVKDWDGICCDHGLGHYNVTSYGQMIVQGGRFEREEARIFDLPYDSNLSPSQSPSVSSLPSSSPTTSSRPSVKPSLEPSTTPTLMLSQPPSASSAPSTRVPSSFPTTSLAPTITPRPTFGVTTSFPTYVPTTSMAPTITPWPTFDATFFPTFVPTFESQITPFPTESPQPGNPSDESTSEPTVPISMRPTNNGNSNPSSFTSTPAAPIPVRPNDREYCETACVDEVECQEMCAEISLEWGWSADEQSDTLLPYAGCFVADSRCYFGNFEGGDYEADQSFDIGRIRRLCCDNI